MRLLTAPAVVGALTAGLLLAACPTLPVDDDRAPEDVAGLRINEVAAAGVPSDWIELTNVGDEDIALDRVTYSDNAASPAKGTFAAGLVVAPGAFVVVDVDDAAVGFKLGSDEAVYLFATSEAEPDTAVLVDEVDWAEGAAPVGARWPASPTATATSPRSRPTPAAPPTTAERQTAEARSKPIPPTSRAWFHGS